jgi:hypothetical protein
LVLEAEEDEEVTAVVAWGAATWEDAESAESAAAAAALEDEVAAAVAWGATWETAALDDEKVMGMALVALEDEEAAGMMVAADWGATKVAWAADEGDEAVDEGEDVEEAWAAVMVEAATGEAGWVEVGKGAGARVAVAMAVAGKGAGARVAVAMATEAAGMAMVAMAMAVAAMEAALPIACGMCLPPHQVVEGHAALRNTSESFKKACYVQ